MRGMPWWFRFVVVALLALGTAGMRGGQPAYADSTLTCPTFSELTGAIGSASSGDTLTLSCSYEDDVTFTGAVSVSDTLTLAVDSGSVGNIVLFGNYSTRFFTVTSGGNLSLNGLVMSGGSSGTTGGAVLVQSGGTLNAVNTVISNNSASVGAGIDNQGTLTVTGGDFSGDSASTQGGAIFNDTGAGATISNATFESNTASRGAAVNNHGVAHLAGDTFTNNTAGQSGGAITSGNASGTLPSLTLTATTVSANQTGSSGKSLGGGLYVADGTVDISDSTFSANSAAAGGALYLDNDGTYGAQVTVSGSTLSGNLAVNNTHTASEGGAAFVGAMSSLSLTQSTLSGNSVTTSGTTNGGGAVALYSSLSVTNSTIAGNSGPAGLGGGLAIHAVSPTITGSIIANNTGGNCRLDSTTLSDGGYNLEDDGGASCGFSAASNDLFGVDPSLGALGNNGGTTQTMALQAGSTAIDAIPAGSAGCPSGAPGTDQRGTGYARPDAEDTDGRCDIGAFEYQDSGTTQLPQTITFTGPSQTSYTYGDGSFTVSANGGSSGNPVTFSVAPASQTVCSSGDTNSATVTILGAGTCTVQADQAGSSGYTAATEVSEDITVNPKPLAVSVSHADISYGDGAPSTFTVNFTGWVGSDASVPTAVTGTPSCGVPSYAPGSGPGNYDITCTVGTLQSTNYSFVDGSNTDLPSNVSTAAKLGTLTVDKAQTTLVLSSLLQSYDGTPKAVTVTTNPAGLSGVSVSYTGTHGTTYGPTSMPPTGTGSYSVSAGLSNPDYTAASVQGTEYVDTSLASFPKLGGVYNLGGVNLSGAYLAGANLAGAILSPGNFKGTVFGYATLTHANLSSANFTGADFSYADLSFSNLSGGNFSAANFSHATLTGANLSGANLKGATGLSTAATVGVIWNKTVCPDGTNSNNDGGTCVGHG